MSVFDLGSNVEESVEIDSLGGGLVSSGIYDFTIDTAYLTKSKGGAMGITLVFKTANNQIVREQGWISSGDAKGNSFTYEKDGKKFPLPDYAKLDNLCKLSIGKGLKELDPEKKTIKLYDHELKKEVPKEVPVLVDLIGAEITAGVLKVTEDKKKQNAATGIYEATGETRDINEVHKYFRTSDKLTAAEIQAQETSPEFMEKWKVKYAGKDINRAKGAASSGAQAGIPAATNASAPAPAKSLFGTTE